MTASTPAPPGIFISYRRNDSAAYAGWLFDRLAGHFGRDQIFKDVDSIELGDDFAVAISDAVASCRVLLALIGDRWLTVTGKAGRRLDNPRDFVRLEIEAALSRNIRVIPILIDGAKMPDADQLPASLAGLRARQALELSTNRFDSDFGRLLKVLDKTFSTSQTARPRTATPGQPFPRRSNHRSASGGCRSSVPCFRRSSPPLEPPPPEHPPPEQQYSACRSAVSMCTRRVI